MIEFYDYTPVVIIVEFSEASHCNETGISLRIINGMSAMLMVVEASRANGLTSPFLETANR